jgi:isochorismate synthase
LKHKRFIYYSRNSQQFQSAVLTPNSEGQFILAPFTGDEMRFDYDACNLEELDFSQNDLSAASINNTSKEVHLKMVQQAIDAIDKGHLNKVVISRKKNIEGAFDIPQILLQLQASFPNTFVYCIRLNDQMWIGATPEILIEGHGNKFKTYSLAGTKTVNEAFSQKEIDEQKIVTDYIALKLADTENLRIEPTTELVYNNIKHLLSVIHFENISVSEGLKKLHPTPAVLGTPSSIALELIQNTEPYARELYTGYIGFTSDTETYVYVNLRCGKVHANGIELFVGGGIVKYSVPEDEWIETENKVATFTAILNQHTLEGI